MGAPTLTPAPVDPVAFMRGCRIFTNQPDGLLRRLAAYSELRTFDAGDTILTEGQINENLYLLIEGRVTVYVGGEPLASLQEPGDLFGEASAATSQRCSATVITTAPTRALTFAIVKLRREQPSDQEMTVFLYQTYAVMLAEKLRQTNDKAKMHEATSRQLAAAKDSLTRAQGNLQREVEDRTKELHEKMQQVLETNLELELQKDALIASRRLMEDLARTRATALERIAEMYRTHVTSLRERLAPLTSGAQVGPRDLFALRRDVDGLSLEIAPLLSLYSEAIAWRGQRLLFATRDRRRRMMATTALSGTGVELTVAANSDDAIEAMSQVDFDLVCVGDDLLEVANAATQGGRRPLVWAATLNESVVRALRAAPPTHFLASHPRDRLFGVRAMTTALGKLASGHVFGIEPHVTLGSEVHACSIDGSEDRGRILRELEDYLRGLGLRETIIVRCTSVAEELLTNAVYDAPVDAQGKPRYQNVSRTDRVRLLPEEVSIMRYACDGVVVAVAVEDPFGALPLGTILEYLEGGFASRSMTREGKTGGGLGFLQIVGNADFVAFNVQPGRRTEVIAVFRIETDDSDEAEVAAFQYLTDFSSPK